MEDSPKFAVFGGGSWATAIVKMLCENLEHVGWYMRNVDAIKHIKKEQHNPNYLSAVEFDTNKLKLSNDINEMVGVCRLPYFCYSFCVYTPRIRKTKGLFRWEGYYICHKRYRSRK